MKYLCIEECVCSDTTKENDTHYVRYVKNKSYTLEGLRPILDINPKFITTNFIAISDTDESVVDYGFEEETFYLCIDTFVDDTSDYMFEKSQIYYCTAFNSLKSLSAKTRSNSARCSALSSSLQPRYFAISFAIGWIKSSIVSRMNSK